MLNVYVPREVFEGETRVAATPETVREHVRRNIETFKPGGGYVFNNVHNIQAGVPAENVLAMYDAAYEFGIYE